MEEPTPPHVAPEQNSDCESSTQIADCGYLVARKALSSRF